MESQQPGKLSSKSETLHRSGRKRDPRLDTNEDENDPDSVENGKRQGCLLLCCSLLEKDEIIDLDVAYMTLFEEGNNEFMKERDTEDSERIPIPQRIYTTFLESVESDVIEYVHFTLIIRCSLLM